MGSAFSNIFNPDKPGRGLSKEQVAKEREKVTVGGFFKVLKRKFWQLMQLNLLSFVFFLPVMALVYVASLYVVPNTSLLESAASSDQAYVALWHLTNTATDNLIWQSAWWTDCFYRIMFAVVFVVVPMVAIGPTQAGFTYILQSFIKEKPVFITHDFFARAKSNFKQSLLVSIIDLFVTAFFVLDIYLYNQILLMNKNSFLWTACFVLMVVLFLVYAVMHLYIYPILVTFNVTLRQLYKNSFLLAMRSFFPGLLVLGLNLLLMFLLVSFVTNPMYLIIILAVIVFGFLGLMNNYFSFKYIKFYLLDPALAAAEQKREGENV